MDSAEPVQTTWIGAIRLNVTNIDRAAAFYEAGLGFTVETREQSRTTLSLGGEKLQLVQAPSGAAPYPADCAANDPWFQHFAIRVSDMPAAYARVTRQQQTPISIGGPQQLPPSTGSVIAYKFRDPDGHPLEVSFVPGRPQGLEGASPFVAIDHTAVAVADIGKSIAFWVGLLGFRETGRLLNQGPAQQSLDGLPGAILDIIVLKPAGGGPHVELLHYRKPIPRSALQFGPEDIPSTRLCISATPTLKGERLGSLELDSVVEEGWVLADPDGHLVELANVPTRGA